MPWDLHYPGGESALAWLPVGSLAGVQSVVNLAVIAGLWFVCRRMEGRLAGLIAVTWWVAWPSTWNAAAFPYYYFWPIPFTVGLAALWTWRGVETRWTTPLMIAWAQFRMTALGPMVASRRWLAIAATVALVAGGHGRTQVWHDLYIGIGVWPNPYGIVYSDEHAAKFAAARGVAFKAPEYEPLLRREYLRIASERPWLIARNAVLNTACGMFGLSFMRAKYLLWVAPLILWTAWRRPGVYRALTLVWLSQCATIGFVTRPQEGYLWETMGLYVILGSVGLSRAIFAAADEWEPFSS